MVAIAVDAIQAKHKGKIFSLKEMIKKYLLLRESPSMTPLPDPNIAPKEHYTTDPLPKNTMKKWNQANLGNFNPHLDKAHRKSGIVLVGKDVYYRNVMLFI